MTARLNHAQNAPELTQKLTELTHRIHADVEPILVSLINIRVSQLNGCAFCLDMHIKEAKIRGEKELRLYHVCIWRESPLFSQRERAALEWAEAVTRLSDKGVPDDVFARVREQFSAKELSGLTFAIGAINFWNRLAISAQSVPGSLDKLFGLERAGLGA